MIPFSYLTCRDTRDTENNQEEEEVEEDEGVPDLVSNSGHSDEEDTIEDINEEAPLYRRHPYPGHAKLAEYRKTIWKTGRSLLMKYSRS